MINIDYKKVLMKKKALHCRNSETFSRPLALPELFCLTQGFPNLGTTVVKYLLLKYGKQIKTIMSDGLKETRSL